MTLLIAANIFSRVSIIVCFLFLSDSTTQMIDNMDAGQKIPGINDSNYLEPSTLQVGRHKQQGQQQQQLSSNRTMDNFPVDQPVDRSNHLRPPTVPKQLANTPQKTKRRRVVEAFKTTMLRILGLKSEPKPKDRVKVPQYMMDLYKQYTARNRWKSRKPPRSKSKSRSKSRFFAGNTIRSFIAKVVESGEMDELESEDKEQRYDQLEANTFITFNITTLATDEVINGAELRLMYQATSPHRTLPSSELSRPRRGVGDRTANASSRGQRFIPPHKISVYQLLGPASGSGQNHSEATRRRLIDSVIVTSGSSGWKSFDVSRAVASWKYGKLPNLGFEILVTTLDNRPVHRDAGGQVRIRRSAAVDKRQTGSDDDVDARPDSSHRDESDIQPMLVTYADDRISGSAVEPETGTFRPAAKKKRHRKDTGRRRHPHWCRRRSLYVDFSEVDWDDWIIAPPGYDAYLCQGSCPVFLPDSLNATNHAQVQSLLHSSDSKLVPAPCCVPTELSPISMLYYDDADKVVLRNYQDMVVESCGCR